MITNIIVKRTDVYYNNYSRNVINLLCLLLPAVSVDKARVLGEH